MIIEYNIYFKSWNFMCNFVFYFNNNTESAQAKNVDCFEKLLERDVFSDDHDWI